MKSLVSFLCVSLAAISVFGISGCSKDTITEPSVSTIDSTELLAGGATTVFLANSNAFRTPAPNLDYAGQQFHALGDAAFDATFVSYPGPVNPGLGPIYNNTSCVSCHVRDGRGTPLNNAGALSSILFRLSIAGADEHGGPNPVPGFGGQLQQRAVAGVQPEGSIDITYSDVPVTFDDGEVYHLRAPEYSPTNTYIPMPAGTMISPRMAPPVFGLGLLEAVSEETILSHADPSDNDGDGIKGRANYVWDAVHQTTAIGRFGWKANVPNLKQQTAGAYNGDMGITTPLFPVKSCHGQPQAIGYEYDKVDVDSLTLAAATYYVQTLGVPARRNLNDASVIRGKQVFADARCGSCHLPTMKTGTLDGISQVSNQTIHPYTDLLVHDMGDGLADQRPDFQAGGRDWRTQPLWGIGLTQTVNGHTFFLHDGRARDLMEAILWHDGEAVASKNYVKKLSKADRTALIAFLNSL